jgi:DMSO/TMAO reductase YedYZ molybdopterin-dependent catalytic subunit
MTDTSPLKTVGDRGDLHNPNPLGTAESWRLTVRLEGDEDRKYSLPELLRLMPEPWSEAMNIDCVSSGNIDGGKPVRFGGIPFAALFNDLALGDKLGPIEELRPTVLFRSLAPGGCGPRPEKHWTALPLRDCLDPDNQVILTTSLNGQPLPYENGGPFRSVVGPRLFFYKGVKWLSEIDFRLGSLDDFRGTWEDYAGYHNRARTAENERFEPRMRIIKEVRWDENGLPYDVSELVPQEAWKDTWEGMLRNKDLSRLIASRLHKMDLALPASYEGIQFTDGDFKAKLRGCGFSSATFYDVNLQGVNFSLSYFTGAALQGREERSAASGLRLRGRPFPECLPPGRLDGGSDPDQHHVHQRLQIGGRAGKGSQCPQDSQPGWENQRLARPERRKG